jgi:hypothetical protein
MRRGRCAADAALLALVALLAGCGGQRVPAEPRLAGNESRALDGLWVNSTGFSYVRLEIDGPRIEGVAGGCMSQVRGTLAADFDGSRLLVAWPGDVEPTTYALRALGDRRYLVFADRVVEVDAEATREQLARRLGRPARRRRGRA